MLDFLNHGSKDVCPRAVRKSGEVVYLTLRTGVIMLDFLKSRVGTFAPNANPGHPVLQGVLTRSLNPRFQLFVLS